MSLHVIRFLIGARAKIAQSVGVPVFFKSVILTITIAFLPMFIGCAGNDEGELPSKAKIMPYPRPSNIPVKPYRFDVSRVPIRTKIEAASPFYYDGRDTRLIYAIVQDDVLLPNGKLLMPKDSRIFGRQNNMTGRYYMVTRFQYRGFEEWTLASGIAEVKLPGGQSTAFLSHVAIPQQVAK